MKLLDRIFETLNPSPVSSREAVAPTPDATLPATRLSPSPTPYDESDPLFARGLYRPVAYSASSRFFIER